MNANPEWMTFNEAVEHIMRSQKCSRRKAERLLTNAAGQGKLATTGINVETNQREEIPAKAWAEGKLREAQ